MSPENEDDDGEGDRYREIDNRRVVAYLPSKQTKGKLKDISEERGVPMSKLVVEAVRDMLDDSDEDFETRRELLEEKKRLEEELKDTKRDLKVYKKNLDKLEKEVKELRSEKFTKPTSGKRKYSENLVDLLKEEGYIEFEEIYDELDVDPSDTEVVKGFQEQLQALKEYGLIKEEERGWRWKG